MKIVKSFVANILSVMCFRIEVIRNGTSGTAKFMVILGRHV